MIQPLQKFWLSLLLTPLALLCSPQAHANWQPVPDAKIWQLSGSALWRHRCRIESQPD